MTQLLLKTITTLANGTRRETQTAMPEAMGKPLHVNVSANTKQSFRLVDANTGQVIKAQQVVKKGKALQVLVDGQAVLTLDNFFVTEATQANASSASTTETSAATASPNATDSVSYVVNTGTAAQPVYGEITPQTQAVVSQFGVPVLWTEGMAAMPLNEPVAFVAQPVAAIFSTANMGGLAAAVGLAAAAGGGKGGDGASTNNTTADADITGAGFKAEVAVNTGLMVEAFDTNGVSLGTANVNAQGKYYLKLTNSRYKGTLVLKMYDILPNDGITPTFYDEATGNTKNFDKPMYAVVNYAGTGSITTNITPLTNLATAAAGVDTTKDTPKLTVPTGQTATDVVNAANAKVAQKFGLNVNDLTSADVQTTNQDKANAYGRALAVVSQMENSNPTTDFVQTFKNDLKNGTNNLGDSIKSAADTLKTNAGSNTNPYLKNIDTDQLDNLSSNAKDVTAPKLVSAPAIQANTNSDGSKIYLHFDSELSKITANKTAFQLNVGGVKSSGNLINGIVADGQDLVLTLNNALSLTSDQIWSIDYTDPTASNDLLAVQDVAGNDLATFNNLAVVNNVSKTFGISLPAGQSFSYAENQVFKNDFAAKVLATATNTSVTQFRFADTNSSTSADGLYSIDNQGNISLTNAGLQTNRKSNDFEILSTTNSYKVKAGDDLGNWSIPVDVSLNLTNVSEAPTATLTSLNPTFTEAKGQATQAAAVALFKDANVSAVDAGDKITSISLSVSGLLDGADEKLSFTQSSTGFVINLVNSDTNPITYGGLTVHVLNYNVNGTTTSNLVINNITGWTAVEANALLNSLAYQNTNKDFPSAGIRSFKLSGLQDNGSRDNGGQNTSVFDLVSNVTVVPTPDAPVNNFPASLSVDEDTALSFSGLSVAYPGSERLTITLTVTHGKIDVSNVDASKIALSGSGTASVTLTGLAQDINTALSGNKVNYTPALNYNGSDSLTMVSSVVQTPVDPSLTDTDTQAITINSVPDAPLVVQANQALHLPAIFKGTAASTEKTVTDLFKDSFDTSVDGSTFVGVLVVGTANAKNGFWQYQSNGKSDWVDITSNVSVSNAVYLLDTSSLRFVPATGYVGSDDALSVRGLGVKINSSDPLTPITNFAHWLVPSVGVLDALKDGVIKNLSNDTSGYVSTSKVTLDIQVNGINNPPTLTAAPSNLTYSPVRNEASENPVKLFSSASLTGGVGDTTDKITSLTLSISGLAHNNDETLVLGNQSLALANQAGSAFSVPQSFLNGISSQFKVSQCTASKTSSPIYDKLSITFTNASGWTMAEAKALVEALSYKNTSFVYDSQRDLPLAGDRSFSLSMVKDSGGVEGGGIDTAYLTGLTSVVTVKPQEFANEDVPKTIAKFFAVDTSLAENVSLIMGAAHGTMTFSNVVNGVISTASGDVSVSTGLSNTVNLSGSPQAINLVLASFNYTPSANWYGTDSVSIQVTYDSNTSKTSSAVIHVSNSNDAPTGAVTISGIADVGLILTADTSAVTDADNLTSSNRQLNSVSNSFGYQWRRITGPGTNDYEEITGAIFSTYTVTAADQGKKLAVVFHYTDEGGTPEYRTSSASGAVPMPAGPDTEKPVLPDQALSHKGSLNVGDSIGTLGVSPNLTATDNIGVVGYRFSGTDANAKDKYKSADGKFKIDDTGKVYYIDPSGANITTLTYQIEAFDAAGNASVVVAGTQANPALSKGHLVIAIDFSSQQSSQQGGVQQGGGQRNSDTTPPHLLSAEYNLTEDPSSIYLTFDEALSVFAYTSAQGAGANGGTQGGATSASPFTVKVDNVDASIQSAVVEPNANTFLLVRVHITLSSPITAGQVVKVSYADPTPNVNDTSTGSNLVEDSAFNDLASTQTVAIATSTTFTNGNNQGNNGGTPGGSQPPTGGGSGQNQGGGNKIYMGSDQNDDNTTGTDSQFHPFMTTDSFSLNEAVVLQGGKGNDVMQNTKQSDVTYKWVAGDAGTTDNSSAIDYIQQFKVKSSSASTHFDKLDISALLQGFNAQTSHLSDWITEINVAKLSAYDTTNTTTFTIAVNGPDTSVWIKQEIMLEQVDIFSGLNLAANADRDAQLTALKTAGILIA